MNDARWMMFGLAAALGVACVKDSASLEYDPSCAGCRKEGDSCTRAGNCTAGTFCNDPADEDRYRAHVDPLTCVAIIDFNPNCPGCRVDGQSCVYSINCQPGSICNDAVEDLFDAAKPPLTCLKVVCASDADCEAPKRCTLEQLCHAPVCQLDSECAGGERCLAGACRSGPDDGPAQSCRIQTRSGSIRQGATIELAAVVENANGVALPGIELIWTSSDESVVAVRESVAIGGNVAGSATLTAAVAGNPSITCTGLRLINFPALAAGRTRVVVADERSGEPIAGAEVTVQVGGTLIAATDPVLGAVSFETSEAIASITVVKAGYPSISLLAPATNDVFIPISRAPDRTKAGGFRGTVDISATRRADLQLAVAGTPIPANILDLDFSWIGGDPVTTFIDAPELGLNMEEVELPAGAMLGLGNKKFTGDSRGLRCSGITPATNELGCYAVRAPEGRSAAWVLAGQLKLSQVAPVANLLSTMLGGGEELTLGTAGIAVMPLLRTLNHGLRASLDVTEVPKVRAELTVSVDCSNPAVVDYDRHCRPSYEEYQPISLVAGAPQNVLSIISVPALPVAPSGTGCAPAAIVVAGAILPGRGVLPLGFGAGVDVVKDEAPDCKIGGVKQPFGPSSAMLADGRIPFSMAPPHSGVEGSELALLLLAFDPQAIDGTRELTAIVERVDSIGAAIDLSGRAYLARSRAAISRAQGTVTLEQPVAGADAIRIDLRGGGQRWIVYAPATMAAISLPDVPSARAVLDTAGEAQLEAFSIEGDYRAIWELGSGKNLDGLIGAIEAVVVQQCAAGAACDYR